MEFRRQSAQTAPLAYGGWAQGDALTQQLLAQIQQSSSGYGLDALDAANAALKTAGKTVKVIDNNPPKQKTENKTNK